MSTCLAVYKFESGHFNVGRKNSKYIELPIGTNGLHILDKGVYIRPKSKEQ